MIISDLVMEVVQRELILKLHCVWKSNEQTPALLLHSSCVWLCCPQPGEMLLPLADSFEPQRGCVAASIEPQWHGREHKMVKTPSNPINFKSIPGYCYHHHCSSASMLSSSISKFWQLLLGMRSQNLWN